MSLQVSFDFVRPKTQIEAQFRVLRELPDSRDELLVEARKALKAYDAALTAANAPEDGRDAVRHHHRLEIIAGKFGYDILEPLAAEPGKIPLHGQAGSFIIEVAGCRAIISVRSILDDYGRNTIRALDYDRPFIGHEAYTELDEDFGPPKPKETVKRMVQREIKEGMTAWTWNRSGKHVRKLQPLVALEEGGGRFVDDVWEEFPFEPPLDDPAWQPGGWIYEFLQKHPAPACD